MAKALAREALNFHRLLQVPAGVMRGAKTWGFLCSLDLSMSLATCLQDGLVIVSARYGVLEEILRHERSHASSSEEASTGAESTHRTEEHQSDSRGAAGLPLHSMLLKTSDYTTWSLEWSLLTSNPATASRQASDVSEVSTSGKACVNRSICHSITVFCGCCGTMILFLLRLQLHADAEDEEGTIDPQERAAVEAAVAARTGTRERPPPWLDVTTALQFMAEDGRLVFHAVSARHLLTRHTRT